jgi:ribonuclease HI
MYWAAAWEPKRNLQGKVYVGPSDSFTVYGAELIGIMIALNMAIKDPRAKRLTVFTDNQASIISSARPGNQSGQVILRHIHHLVTVLHRRKCQVTIRWIPAHTGVEGNEMADLLAKHATGWRHKKDPSPRTKGVRWPWLPQLLSSCKRMINMRARWAWERQWADGPTGERYRQRWKGRRPEGAPLLDRHINEIYNSLSKAEAAVLIQMRTETIGLQSYLYKIKRAEQPWCVCDQAPETARHILEDCEAFDDLRYEYLHTSHVTDSRSFLGRGDPEWIKPTVSFMMATGLLDQFRLVEPMHTHSLLE